MIARLTGRPAGVRGDALVLDVGGVGYLVQATQSAFRKAQGADEVVLEVYTHVREDALQLFGFAEPSERELFEHLLSVSGVGPRVALAIVSGSAPADLVRAIALEDTDQFVAIPGIGKKTAQRVVLELREKLGAETAAAVEARSGSAPELVARDALVELGFSVVEAERALDGIASDLDPEERVRQALRRAA
jgi:holliday junction DNA helicase RuvA